MFLAGLNKDPDNTPDIKDLNTWRSLAETEKRRGEYSSADSAWFRNFFLEHQILKTTRCNTGFFVLPVVSVSRENFSLK